MLEAIGFLTSRTGIVLVSSVLISGTLVWGYSQKVAKLELEKKVALSERDYQQRIATALEKQRIALQEAAIEEQKRLVSIEEKWKKVQASLESTKDYENTAPVSVVRALNGLSELTNNRKATLSAGSNTSVD